MKKNIKKNQKLVVWAALSLVVLAGIVIYLIVTNNSTKKVAEKPLYIALGDSVASGQGLISNSDSSACNRTNESYPNVVASNLGYQLHSLACSGAKVDAEITGPQIVNEAKIDSQIVQIGTQKPKLVTITIGANDVGWVGFIAKCLLLTCGSDADTQEATTNINNFSSKLDSTLAGLKDKIATDGKVIITGYYPVFPESKEKCSTDSTVPQAGMTWLNDQAKNLNNAISSQAQKYPFAKFAPVSFSGHELCTSSPWIQQLSDKSPFHPSIEGQNAIADAVIAAN